MIIYYNFEVNMVVYSLKEKPELLNKINTINQKVWPEFMLHWDCSAWSHLFSTFADYQILLTREEDILAYGFTIPLYWGEKLIDIPDNLKILIENGVETKEKGLKPNILLALAAVVSPKSKGEGLSYEIVKLMKELYINKNFDSLIVPVRPTLKSKYPLIPIENYAYWKKEDGLAFDPWLRVHDKLGGKILKTARTSMIITGKIKEWEEWSKLKIPESGKYIIEGALNPVEINYDQDIGIYSDPCIWVKY
jgi:hypothetical protein